MQYNYSIGLIDEKCNFVYKANAELNRASCGKKQTKLQMAIIQIDPIVSYLKNNLKKKEFFIHFKDEQYVISAKIVKCHRVNQEWHFNIDGNPTTITIADYMNKVSIGKLKCVTMLVSEINMIETIRRLTF